MAVRPGATIEHSPLDVWLSGRWRAFSRSLGVLWETPVSHEPWPLAEATVEDLHQDLTGACGLPAPGGDPLVRYSPGVRRARLGISRPHRLR